MRQVFACIAIFNLLRLPLFLFPTFLLRVVQVPVLHSLYLAFKAIVAKQTCNQLGVSLRRLAAFLGAEELEEQRAISDGPEKIQVLDSLTVDVLS